MSDKRITVRDIAARLKVSSGTVHRALNDKPGVGEELRQQIRQVAEEMGYRPNVLAATLKMKPLRIVLAFPQQERGDRFYYHYVWQGCRDRMENYSDYRLETLEMPYSRDGIDPEQTFGSCMERLLKQYGGEIDGVIAGGLMRGPDALEVERLAQRGIPVVMLCESVAAQSSLCVVQSNHYADGQVAAELLRSHIAPGSRILVCAGSSEMNSNIENLRGFQDGLGDDYRLKTIYGVFEHEQLEQKLYDSLSGGRYQGAYSVAARSTPPLSDAIRRLGLQQQICVVGSEVFPESVQALQDGTVNYLLYKKPREQGALGADLLLDQLLRHIPPRQKLVQINSAIVIKSNAALYLQELERDQ